ncbi:hypothetical protein Tco_0877479 [Tanacetum coccineum]|uniref:Uncharacterized protein n=1 Tax=Tanacetum coccineum TaxID=301880 RepID=A0ABQ5BWQ0_9ASTR
MLSGLLGIMQLLRGFQGQRFPKPRVRDSNFFKEHMLLEKKDEAGITLIEEENDFLLADVNDEEELEKRNASCIMMARI